MKRLMLIIAVCACALQVLATQYSLGDGPRLVSGSLDFMNWSGTWPGCGGNAPVDGDSFYIQGYAKEKELYFTSDLTVGADFSIMTGHTQAGTGAGNVFILDTKDYGFLFPKSTGEALSGSKIPLQLWTYVPTTGKNEQIVNVARDAASADASWGFSKLRLVQATAQDYSTALDFTSGTFNCYDPSGEGTGENGYTFRTMSANIPATVTFAPGTVLRAGAVLTSASLGTLVFNGATCFADRSLNNDQGKLFVTNGAVVAVGGTGGGVLTVGSAAEMYVDGKDTSVTAKSFNANGKFVQAGGALQINGAVAGGTSTKYLQTGGSLTVPNNLNNTGGSFVFAGGTVRTDYATKVEGSTGVMVFSNGVDAAIAYESKGQFRINAGKVLATGAGTQVKVPGTITPNGGTGADFEVREGATLTYGTINASGTTKMRFVDGAIATGSTATFGGVTNVIAGAGTQFKATDTLTVCPQRLVVGEGASVLANNLAFSGDNAELVIDGGTYTNDVNDLNLNGSSAASPLITVNSGSFVTTKRVYLGSGAGKAGRIVVNGGYVELQKEASDNLIMGYQGGEGSLVVNGGEVMTSRIRMGRDSSSAAPGASLVEMNGGEFNISGDDGILFFQSTTGADGAHEVRLNGGVLSVKQITSGMATPNPSKVSGNGGTVRAVETKTGYFSQINTIACGAKGLAFDTAGLEIGFANDLENDGTAEGLFRKVGDGTLTITPPNAKWTVANLSVEQGTLVLAGDISGATKLSVGEGAVFSTVGAADRIALGGLTLSHATLKLDPGDVLAVDGPVAVSGLTLDWSTMPAATEVSFLDVAGELDAETQSALRKALSATPVASGYHQRISFAFDGTRTAVKASVVEDEPLPESANRTWTGTGAWAMAGNWEGSAVPTELDRAAFTDPSAGKTVSVAAGDKAGAIRFGVDGYTLTGTGPLAIEGEQGAEEIAVTAGSQEIAAPVEASASVNVILAPDTSLSVSAPMTAPGFAKSGKGRLTLASDNAFSDTVSMHDGFTTVKTSGAFDGSRQASLVGGTLEFASADGEGLSVEDPVVLAAPDETSMAILKADTDVELANYQATSGALMKRGVGKATIVVGAGKSVALANSSVGLNSASVPFAFPTDGSSLASGQYPALGIAEGELELKGEGEGAQATLPGTGGLVVGVPVNGCQAQAELTIDNLALDASQSTFNPGYKLRSDTSITNPVLRIVNGGSLKVKTMQPGYSSTYTHNYVTVAMTNGTLQCLNVSYLSRMYDWSYRSDDLCYVDYQLKDSNLLFGGGNAQLGGGIRLDAVGTFLGADSNGNPIGLTTVSGETMRNSGEMFFRDGSVFAVKSIANAVEQAYDLTFAFDNAEWRWTVGGDADFTLNETALPAFRYEMRGQGVMLKPASGRTFRTNVPFVGAGGMIVDGPGTVAFGAGAYAFTGACNLTNAAATADLTDAGPVARACFSGVGTVKGGTIARAIIASGFADDWTTAALPVFADCGITKLVVDAGRTAENPLVLPETPTPIAVARVSGTTSIAGFRVINTGDKRVSGSFEVVNGTVYMTPGNGPGVLLIVR